MAKTTKTSKATKPRKPRKKRIKTVQQRVEDAVGDRPRSHSDPKEMGKSSRAAGKWEVAKRIVAVERLMAGGATHEEIVAYATSRWKVARSTVERYKHQIRKHWHDMEAELRTERRVELRAKLNLVYQTAMKRGAVAAAAKVLNMLAKFDGLYEPDRVTVTVEDMDDRTAREYIEHAHSTMKLAESERAKTALH